VIPTHKRPHILRRCLEHLEKQTIAGHIETIVVSDGPDDMARRVVEDKGWTLPVRFFEIPKSQQGVARNKGVSEARADHVLFIGDDIFLSPDACEKHLNAHVVRFPGVENLVLGFTTWDPACGVTPVMRWLEKSGWQFGYPFIKRYAGHFLPDAMQQRFTYTSHMSLPTKIARKFAFREDVTFYGWEDIEWGWRLKNAGIKLFYEAGATALHHHHIEMADSLHRMETLGRSAVIMDRLSPGMNLTPTGRRLLKYRAAALLPGMRGAHTRAFLRGCSL
jgi:glycosyltransferase involved in cell wall biosynthesis